MNFFEEDTSIDTPAKGATKKPTPAEQAYLDLEARSHAERVVRAAGRSASPEFLKAIAYELISLASAKGGAR